MRKIKKHEALPPYTVIDMQHPNQHPILRVPAAKLQFPLSEEDWEDVRRTEAKYNQEVNMAGIAAVQIGIPKQIMVFATQSMPKSIWINPSFEPIGKEKVEDDEGCFSVIGFAGTVKRFKRIRYTAYDLEGNRIEGIAEGYLARVIQHEVDHLNGKLFIDYVPKGQLYEIEALGERRHSRKKR